MQPYARSAPRDVSGVSRAVARQPQEVAKALSACAWALLAPEAKRAPTDRLIQALEGTMQGHGWQPLLQAQPEAPARGEAPWLALAQLDAALTDESRRAQGIYLTPPTLARQVALAVGQPAPHQCAVDLSAGSAELLLALARAHPQLTCVGVELEPALALAGALRLLRLRAQQPERPSQPPDRMICGDGLAAGVLDGLAQPVGVVVGNPPYVGEKGNAALFAWLRQAHPHLASWFGPRMDLLYLFFHRALDLLEPGGRLAYLTSAYWLQATGAATLRQDLAARASSLELVRFEGRGLFEDAPGHESLLCVAARAGVACGQAQAQAQVQAQVRTVSAQQHAASLEQSPPRQVALEASGRPWRPFVQPEDERWLARWLSDAPARLGELVQDRQGFVSGADRVEARHMRAFPEQASAWRVGSPIFVFEPAQVPPLLWPLRGTLLLPLLRGSSLRADAIHHQASEQAWALYVDGPLCAEALERVTAHLAPYRPLLEARREVAQGLIPWYRLHWPRRASEQRGPKLVCPRRAKAPQLALDLAGHVVSSDCTYLVAPPWSEAPVEDLALLMAVLNSEPAWRALALMGKRKGDLLELYAQPLRAWPLPLQRQGQRLALTSTAPEALVRPAQRVLDALRSPRHEGSGKS